MNFTAKDVVALREKTGCGMMDCKKALIASNGDADAAIDFLREKGLAASQKKASRIAAEGIAFAKVNADATAGVVIEVNAETDFVAKNAQFGAFVENCADTVLESNPADVDALLAAKAAGSDLTIADELREKFLESVLWLSLKRTLPSRQKMNSRHLPRISACRSPLQIRLIWTRKMFLPMCWSMKRKFCWSRL